MCNATLMFWLLCVLLGFLWELRGGFSSFPELCL